MRASRIISGCTVPLVLVLAAGNGLAGLPGPVASAAAAITTSVMSWGDNSAGELGDGTLTASTAPLAVGGSGGLRAISAGGRHVLGLLSNGTVLSWGDDTSGQIGNGLASAGDNAENPVAVNGLTGVTAVSAGTEHSLALLSNGTVMAWGDNTRGELGDGTHTSSAVPVAVKGLTGVKAVSAGNEFSLALLTDGRVMAWGDGVDGQLGDGKFASSDVPVAVSGLTGVTAVSAGGYHALALMSGGTVQAWGEDIDGQLGDGAQPGDSNLPVKVKNLSSAIAISAGDVFSLALLSGGTVDGWGDNGFFELAQPNGFPGGIGSSNVPVQLPGLASVTAISAGGLFGLALLSNGTVDGWGDGAFGQLGNGSTNTIMTPAAVTGLTGVSKISASSVSGTALVGTAAPAPPTPVPSVWQVSATPVPHNPTTVSDEEFNGVSAVGTGQAWAVGNQSKSTPGPLAERWNGTAWSKVKAPLPTGASSGTFNGVDDLSPGNAWAVGSSAASGSTFTQSLIEHWSGGHWTVVPSPDPGISNTLTAIGGTGPNDLWAVGWFENSTEQFIAMLLLHWNGTAWSFTTPPSEGGIQLAEAVTAITPDDVWVVGDTATETVSAHWDGTSWTQVATPILTSKDSDNHLTGVMALGANDIWATGYEGNVNDQLFSLPYVLHWTGSSWTLTQTPNTGTEGSQLRAIHTFSSTDIWAVGTTQQTDGALLALTEHFNGTSWSVSPALDPGQIGPAPDNNLSAVTSPAAKTLWAVGTQEIAGQCCVRTLALTTSRG
jgi:alpha-tubulin suppressor-like RCC1 family protein